MALLLLLAACETGSVTTAPDCLLTAPILDPTAAAPGDAVRATVERATDTWDTVVTVGDTPAEVLGLVREGCDDCDSCRTEQDCEACGTCDACTASCAACVEAVRFRVPEVAPGAHPVGVTNRYGATRTATLTVMGETDTADTAGR